jgi:hypothetical protein
MCILHAFAKLAMEDLRDFSKERAYKPVVGNLPDCCARAASGHATAAPPRSVMN